MKGKIGIQIFLALLGAAVACFVVGWPWAGLATLVAAFLAFAFWPVDRSAR